MKMQFFPSILKAFCITLLAVLFISCDTTDPPLTYTLNTTVSPGEAGTITPSGGEFEAGTQIDIEAQATEEWMFVRWEGDISGNENPASILFDSNKDVTAVFDAAPELMGMGRNDFGPLGDGTTTDRHTPIPVDSDVVSMDGGEFHSLYIKVNRMLWVMGLNHRGQLGDGSTSTRYTPVQIDSSAVSVAAGNAHSMYVKSDGTLWAMGFNGEGQLGDGTTTDRHTPVHVASNVEKVAAGERHSFFVKTDGTLWAMGFNGEGQLGDGTAADRHTPIQVDSDVVSMAGGHAHSLYVKSDGTLWAMGGIIMASWVMDQQTSVIPRCRLTRM